jgi:hypothetical protein
MTDKEGFPPEKISDDTKEVLRRIREKKSGKSGPTKKSVRKI